MTKTRREFLELGSRAAGGLLLLSISSACESFAIGGEADAQTAAFLTPQQDWFWFSALEDPPRSAPRIAADDWTLDVRSGGRSVGEIGYRKLKALEADGLAVQYIKTMRCIFGAYAAEPLDTRAATGVVRGIPLRTVLDDTSISGDTAKLRIEALDGFTTSLPYDRILDDTKLPVILAYELNGEPITPERGGPVRLIVPEMWAYKSIKWVSTIDATSDFSSYGTFETGAFAGKTHVDNPGLMALMTLVHSPGALVATVPGPDVTLHGMTLVGGASVVSVEVQVDDGEWELATISPLEEVLEAAGHDALLIRSSAQYGQDWPFPNVWAPWRHTVRGLTTGNHSITVRSVDETGRANPSVVADPHELAQHVSLELEVTA